MKVTRSVKCHFGEWLTDTKKRQLKRYLSEYHRVVTEAIKIFETSICNGQKKTDLLLAKNLIQVDSWFTARAKKNAFAEAYGLVKGTWESAKALKKTYKTPTHLNQMMLAETCSKLTLAPKLVGHDLLVDVFCMDGFKTKNIAIPLKRNRLFNKYIADGWTLAKTVTVHKDYVQFTFSKEIPKRKEGGIVGVDPGATNLLSTDDGQFFGTDIRRLLDKLKRKKRCSSAWYACRDEIQQYIDKALKDLVTSKDLQLLVLEDNKKIKYKSKLKGRLSRNMRSVLSGWAIGRINVRTEMLCEANGVSLRRVPAYRNSCTCPGCGSTDKRNRASQAEFICVDCGSVYHADTVGGMNSLARFCLGKYGSEYKQAFMVKYPSYFGCIDLPKFA
jgi:transposase